MGSDWKKERRGERKKEKEGDFTKLMSHSMRKREKEKERGWSKLTVTTTLPEPKVTGSSQ